MENFNPTELVKKSMVGRSGAFKGYDDKIYYGKLTEVKNGYAVFIYYAPGSGDCRTVVKVRENRLEIY